MNAARNRYQKPAGRSNAPSVKCTFCYDRQRGGLVPACAKACPTESILFGPLDELRAHAAQRVADLHALGWLAVIAETCVWLLLELRRHGAVDRAVHEGRSGALLRSAGILTGPVALVLRAAGMRFWPALLLADTAAKKGVRAGATSPVAVTLSLPGCFVDVACFPFLAFLFTFAFDVFR